MGIEAKADIERISFSNIIQYDPLTHERHLVRRRAVTNGAKGEVFDLQRAKRCLSVADVLNAYRPLNDANRHDVIGNVQG